MRPSGSVSRTMGAFVLDRHGDPDKLAFREDWPLREPGPTDALVDLRGFGPDDTGVDTHSGWYSRDVSAPMTGGARAGITGSAPVRDGAPARTCPGRANCGF